MDGLQRDPTEMNNLYDNPEYQKVVQNLKAELARLQEIVGDDINDIGDLVDED